MLIVACQFCGEYKVLAEAPDEDGWARVCWICPRCGAGQVLQLEVTADSRGNLESIILGLGMVLHDMGASQEPFLEGK